MSGSGNRNVKVKTDDSPSIDAFARLRVSNPITIFESKQVYDNQPFFWDDQEVSGSGTSSVHSSDEARSRLSVSNLTAGRRVRQTFMSFNYQPGKSQLIIMTARLASAPAAGIRGAVGSFDDDNGIFFEMDGTTMYAVCRSNATGTPVERRVAQADFNIDTVDGNGASGLNIDPTKTQIILIDYEWLGVGRVRMGFVYNGTVIYCHQFLNANNLDVVYMSTPNLPIRYELENDGTGPATSMDAICATVMSEGGSRRPGRLVYESVGDTFINANTSGDIYVIGGIRLKASHIGATIIIEDVSLLNGTADDYEWMLLLNPTLANAVTFSDVSGSSAQFAPGNPGAHSNSTVTAEGLKLQGGFVKASGSTGAFNSSIVNTLYLGAAIDGTLDEIYLCARPLSSNADMYGGITWRDVS